MDGVSLRGLKIIRLIAPKSSEEHVSEELFCAGKSKYWFSFSFALGGVVCLASLS